MLKQNRNLAIVLAAAAAAASMTLCVAGCGIKGPLQPPPKAEAAPAQPPLPSNTEPSQLERRP